VEKKNSVVDAHLKCNSQKINFIASAETRMNKGTQRITFCFFKKNSLQRNKKIKLDQMTFWEANHPY
jgi:hypothetical protein